MTSLQLRPYFLLALILGTGWLAFSIFNPFLIPLILAAIFAVILQPLYRLILKDIPRWPSIAAGVTIFFCIVCVVAPLTFIGFTIAAEAQQLYITFQSDAGQTYLYTVAQFAQDTLNHYAPSLAQYTTNVSASIDTYAKQGITWLAQHVGVVFSSLTLLLFGFFIFIVSLYYMLRDGAKLLARITDLSPLADTDDQAVFDRLGLAVNSVIKGSLTVALLQGILTGIGFTIFGIPNSILWGMVAGIMALIPGVGTSLVLIPAIAFLFITGQTFAGAGLLLWGLMGVGLIDNLLGPHLVGKGVKLHPLIILLSVFGGISLFGPAGLFLGPLTVSLLFALVDIYSSSAKERALN